MICIIIAYHCFFCIILFLFVSLYIIIIFSLYHYIFLCIIIYHHHCFLCIIIFLFVILYIIIIFSLYFSLYHNISSSLFFFVSLYFSSSSSLSHVQLRTSRRRTIWPRARALSHWLWMGTPVRRRGVSYEYYFSANYFLLNYVSKTVCLRI